MQRNFLIWSVRALRRFYCSESSVNDASVTSEKSTPVAKLPDRRLHLRFKCGPCGEVSSKWLSKQAYDKGVIIVTCEKCKNRHLIADNLGWFPDVDREKLPKVQNLQKLVTKA